jgi:hypothetical protein
MLVKCGGIVGGGGTINAIHLDFVELNFNAFNIPSKSK